MILLTLFLTNVDLHKGNVQQLFCIPVLHQRVINLNVCKINKKCGVAVLDAVDFSYSMAAGLIVSFILYIIFKRLFNSICLTKVLLSSFQTHIGVHYDKLKYCQ